MDQPDATPDHRKGLSKTLAIAALTGATVVALTLPVANAEPTPPPPTSTAAGQHAPERPAALTRRRRHLRTSMRRRPRRPTPMHHPAAG